MSNQPIMDTFTFQFKNGWKVSILGKEEQLAPNSIYNYLSCGGYIEDPSFNRKEFKDIPPENVGLILTAVACYRESETLITADKGQWLAVPATPR